jgi:nucleoside-diphosphate-sugar epimerase
MKILVTGAAGFLGQRIAHSLLRLGAGPVRLHFRHAVPDALMARLRSEHREAQVEAVCANLAGSGDLTPLVDGIDCIVHAAAGMRGAPADLFANTVVGTRNLLEAAGRRGVRRVVLVSSFSVYRSEPLKRGSTLDEATPTEPIGDTKGPYGYAKVRQEQLFDAYRQRFGFEPVILRPGVIYGPGAGALSPRVGIHAMGLFFSLGGRALLPLTHVDNCADAVALAALKADPGSVFNVVDDDLPTCSQVLRRYHREVQPLRTLRLPYPLLLAASRWLEGYHRRSKGQLPAVFTPCMVRSMYRPLRYSNAALKRLGWQPRIATEEGLSTTFLHLKAQALAPQRR